MLRTKSGSGSWNTYIYCIYEKNLSYEEVVGFPETKNRKYQNKEGTRLVLVRFGKRNYIYNTFIHLDDMNDKIISHVKKLKDLIIRMWGE